MDESLLLTFIVLFNKSFSSVQFSHSVVSDSLRPHESQHTIRKSVKMHIASPQVFVEMQGRGVLGEEQGPWPCNISLNC